MGPSDEIWLARMIEAIQKTKRYQARGRKEFFENEETQQLVIHNLEHLVESADHLSQPFKKGHPMVGWTHLSRVRTMLVHGYADVRVEDVWKFLRDELPVVERRLLKIRTRPAPPH